MVSCSCWAKLGSVLNIDELAPGNPILFIVDPASEPRLPNWISVMAWALICWGGGRPAQGAVVMLIRASSAGRLRPGQCCSVSGKVCPGRPRKPGNLVHFDKGLVKYGTVKNPFSHIKSIKSDFSLF